MNSFPGTLIQIHYHDRPCGVMQVMRSYARIFSKIPGAKRTLLICSRESTEAYPEFPEGAILDLPEAAYKTFRNLSGISVTCQEIFARISALLVSEVLEKPVALMAHNLTLCKNAALVCAFAKLAKKFSSEKSAFRFYSVVHDFAEEGRVAQLDEIYRFRKAGIDIRESIWPVGVPFGIITINARAAATLRRAGRKPMLLENPVRQIPSAGKSKTRSVLMRKLVSHAREKNISFDPALPVYAYPARTIARKNPLEAILFACILRHANLLVGGCGSIAADRRLHSRMRALTKELRLPVVADIQTILSMRDIYHVADAVISTSVSEGFGYLFYEPWLYGKSVCGRRPIGFSFPRRMTEPFLYDRLPVPADWVPVKSARKKSDPYIDFALLDDHSQIRLIRKLTLSRGMLNEWQALLEQPLDGWPGLSSMTAMKTAAILKNSRVVISEFSENTMGRKFARILRKVPKPAAARIKQEIIAEDFGDMRVFRVR